MHGFAGSGLTSSKPCRNSSATPARKGSTPCPIVSVFFTSITKASSPVSGPWRRRVLGEPLLDAELGILTFRTFLTSSRSPGSMRWSPRPTPLDQRVREVDLRHGEHALQEPFACRDLGD